MGKPTRASVNQNIYSDAEIVRRYADLAANGKLFVPERKLLNRHFVDAGGRVLDVGCGVGRTTHHLARRGFDVTGVDTSEEMIRRGRKMFPDLALHVGDAVDLAFKSGSFDYVLFSYAGLDLVKPERNRLRTLAELRRVLRTDGVLAFSSHNGWYALPALLVDQSFLYEFFVKNGNFRRTYKIDVEDTGAEYYLSNPYRQRRQLRETGFELVDVVGKHDGPLRYVERQLYYVARKRVDPTGSGPHSPRNRSTWSIRRWTSSRVPTSWRT